MSGNPLVWSSGSPKYAKVKPKRQVSDAQRQRLRELGMLRQKAPSTSCRKRLNGLAPTPI